MPDLTIEYFYHCQSAECFSTEVEGNNGKKYKVSYGETPRGPYQYDYHCTCDAFKFGKGKPCKHIKQVKASGEHCKWMQFTDGGEVVRKDGEAVCPKCGLSAHSQGYGV